MILGIDFDNTLVSYHALFHRLARERGLIAADFPVDRTAVRDHLRRLGREPDWTELQGWAYGRRMDEAEMFPGAAEFLRRCAAAGVEVRIVSHRTRFPFAGPREDLHAAARRWIEHQGLGRSRGGPVADEEVHFEVSIGAKIARIASAGCTDFIDDLPELLTDPRFPTGVRRYLFDPTATHPPVPGVTALRSWFEAEGQLALRRLGWQVEQAVGAGGNNRVFRVANPAGDKALAKVYFRGPGRDRLASERAFYALAARTAPGWVPRALGWDASAGLGLFEWIEGRQLAPGGAEAADVTAALDFFRALNSGRDFPETDELPLAAEAAFSLGQHVQIVEGRVRRLESLPGGDAREVEAKRLVAAELVPTWEGVRSALGLRDGPGAADLLPPQERCVSPSDFGFHNGLKRADGSWRFFDFEHAGGDDPAKMVCDFFCQPKIPAPPGEFGRFAAEVAAILRLPDAAAFVSRCQLLVPVYRIKWCCIMLNEFLPGERERRLFAAGAAAAPARQERQLASVRSALAALKPAP